MTPASEIISDLVDCLWSYGSAMKMRATAGVIDSLPDAESLPVGQVDQEATINPETLTNENAETTQIIATQSPEVARAPIIVPLTDTPNVSPPSQTQVPALDDLPPYEPRSPYELHDGPTDDGPGPTPGSVTWLTKRSKISSYNEPPSYAESEESSAYIKTVIVGDGACGKTCACRTFTHGVPRLEYIPTVFENYAASMMLGPEAVTLAMWDTAGQEDYDRLRPLSYQQTDVFIVSFAIDSPASLDNVQEKWISEVLHFADPKSRILLAGLKADLRDDEWAKRKLERDGEVPVTYEKALHAARRIGASAYVECSAKTNEGISSLFQVATELGWQKRRPLRAKKCSVM
jgi:Ras homolog gene family, member A